MAAVTLCYTITVVAKNRFKQSLRKTYHILSPNVLMPISHCPNFCDWCIGMVVGMKCVQCTCHCSSYHDLDRYEVTCTNNACASGEVADSVSHVLLFSSLSLMSSRRLIDTLFKFAKSKFVHWHAYAWCFVSLMILGKKQCLGCHICSGNYGLYVIRTAVSIDILHYLGPVGLVLLIVNIWYALLATSCSLQYVLYNCLLIKCY